MLEREALKVNFGDSGGGGDDGNSGKKHRFVCSARALADAFLNFLQNQEEVTMTATPDRFQLKNYIDVLEEEQKAAVHTVLSMQPGEFESYCVVRDPSQSDRNSNSKRADVTYCLKELRAIIAFADAFSLSVAAEFQGGGR